MSDIRSAVAGSPPGRWRRLATVATVAVAAAASGHAAAAAADTSAAVAHGNVTAETASHSAGLQSVRACSVPGLADDAITVTAGHFDYGVQIVSGKLRSRIKDDRRNPPVWRRPNKLLFALGASARKRVPEGNAHAFLGQPGDPVWTIGQTQQAGVPWLGWNTQHPSAVQRIDGPTRWRLDSVIGPGKVFVYQYGPFGDIKKLLGLSNGFPRLLKIPHNTHAHGNWSFTRRGIYRVKTTHTATLRSGVTVTSKGTLFFRVGPCPNGARSTDDVRLVQTRTRSDLLASDRGRPDRGVPHA